MFSKVFSNVRLPIDNNYMHLKYDLKLKGFASNVGQVANDTILMKVGQGFN